MLGRQEYIDKQFEMYPSNFADSYHTTVASTREWAKTNTYLYTTCLIVFIIIAIVLVSGSLKTNSDQWFKIAIAVSIVIIAYILSSINSITK